MTNLKPSVFGNEMLADPFPFYRRLRETHPVFRVVDLWFVAAGLTLTLSGCSGSVYQPLEIRSVGLIPNAKIEKNLRGTANGKSLAFEGGGTWMYGTDSQELNVQPFLATSAKVGNTTFVPPQTLETRSTFRYTTLPCAGAISSQAGPSVMNSREAVVFRVCTSGRRATGCRERKLFTLQISMSASEFCFGSVGRRESKRIVLCFTPIRI